MNDAYAPGDTLDQGEFAPLVLLTPDVGDVHSSKLNYKVGLDYDLAPKVMVYGSVATGYKQGGFFDGNGNFNTNCNLGSCVMYNCTAGGLIP